MCWHSSSFSTSSVHLSAGRRALLSNAATSSARTRARGLWMLMLNVQIEAGIQDNIGLPSITRSLPSELRPRNDLQLRDVDLPCPSLSRGTKSRNRVSISPCTYACNVCDLLVRCPVGMLEKRGRSLRNHSHRNVLQVGQRRPDDRRRSEESIFDLLRGGQLHRLCPRFGPLGSRRRESCSRKRGRRSRRWRKRPR